MIPYIDLCDYHHGSIFHSLNNTMNYLWLKALIYFYALLNLACHKFYEKWLSNDVHLLFPNVLDVVFDALWLYVDALYPSILTFEKDMQTP